MSESPFRYQLTSQFAILDNNTWIITTDDKKRKNILLKRVFYEKIISRIQKYAKVESVKRERFSKSPTFFRPVVTIRVKAALLNAFHNSCSGYRAQYYYSVKKGKKANKYVVDALIPKIEIFLKSYPKWTCPLDWSLRCLKDIGCKVWLDQGIWLYHKKEKDQI